MQQQHLDPETLSGYIDGELSSDELAMVEAHLASCSQCRRELAELRAVSALIRDLPTYRPHKNARVQRPSGKADRTTASGFRYVGPLAIAAIVILAAVAGLAVIDEFGDTDPDEGDQIEFSQAEQDGTDADRSSSQSVADAPAAAPADDEAAMTTLQEAQDAPESGQLAPATDALEEDGDDAESTLASRVRIALYVVMGAALAGVAAWLHYQRARRD